MIEPLIWADAVALLTLNAFARVSDNEVLERSIHDWVLAQVEEFDPEEAAEKSS